MYVSIMQINIRKLKQGMKMAGYEKPVDLAGALGMTRQAVESIIKKRTTTFKTMDKIADVLFCDPKDLLL